MSSGDEYTAFKNSENRTILHIVPSDKNPKALTGQAPESYQPWASQFQPNNYRIPHLLDSNAELENSLKPCSQPFIPRFSTACQTMHSPRIAPQLDETHAFPNLLPGSCTSKVSQHSFSPRCPSPSPSSDSAMGNPLEISQPSLALRSQSRKSRRLLARKEAATLNEFRGIFTDAQIKDAAHALEREELSQEYKKTRRGNEHLIAEHRKVTAKTNSPPTPHQPGTTVPGLPAGHSARRGFLGIPTARVILGNIGFTPRPGAPACVCAVSINFPGTVHYPFECPLRHIQRHGHCVGWLASGTRNPADWIGDDLTPAARAEWICNKKKFRLSAARQSGPDRVAF